MNEKLYYTAAEIAQMIGVGRITAYGIVKQMNEELKSRGFLAVRGKVPKEFFDAKYFGGTRGKEVSAWWQVVQNVIQTERGEYSTGIRIGPEKA